MGTENRKRTNSTSHILSHAGCPIAYDLQGSGPNILLIQGVGVQGAGWRPQTDDLSANFTCMTYDNRGMGRSQPQGTAVTVEQMAADARTLMDAQGWSHAHIVGHSLGGLIAVYLALENPGRVKSLSLLCTFAGGRDAAPLNARMIWLGLRSQLGTRRMRRRGFMRLVLPPGDRSNLDQRAEELASLFGHDLADQPTIVKAQLRAMRAADASARLGELARIPTLVVTAAYDPIAPPKAGRKLAAGITGAKYVEVLEASHGLPITHAAKVNRLLRDHFEGCPK